MIERRRQIKKTDGNLHRTYEPTRLIWRERPKKMQTHPERSNKEKDTIDSRREKVNIVEARVKAGTPAEGLPPKLKSLVIQEVQLSSGSSSFSTPTTPRKPQPSLDISDTFQFPPLEKQHTQEGEQRATIIKEKEISYTQIEPISSIPVTRLPPQTPFVFGSLPPQKPSPHTPVRLRERRTAIAQNKGGRQTNEERLLPEDESPTKDGERNVKKPELSATLE